MKFKEILTRLTGLSSPVFGLSWDPPEPDVKVARRLIVFLEDRRVLFAPTSVEVPDYCVRSVLEIRKLLTYELQSLDSGSELAESMRAMRAAHWKFLDAATSQAEIVEFGAEHGHWASWLFIGALGELRGVFGIHIARLAAAHGLDVEDHLATIFPVDPNKNDSL